MGLLSALTLSWRIIETLERWLPEMITMVKIGIKYTYFHDPVHKECR